jgi:methylmalonyl-CoA carboxyltransferase large subunit
MKNASQKLADPDLLAELREEVARLSARVAALEAARAAPAARGPVAVAPSPTPGPAAAPPVAEGLSEELVLVIGAAIAAFLGKKAHIRQITLLDSATWARQGRVSIQASHTLHRS